MSNILKRASPASSFRGFPSLNQEISGLGIPKTRVKLKTNH